MAFFDNMTGKQKLILIFGSVVVAIAARAIFPEEAQWLVDSAKEIGGVIFQFFANFGGTE